MRTRVIALTTACLALGALSLGVGAAPATSNGSDRSTEPSLPRSANGQEAIGLLGNQLDEAAALNGWTPAQLRSVLASDSTAWVDRTGRVFYKDLPAPPAEGAAPDGPDVAPFPLPNTFTLHSNPTSTKKLFIDFDGTNVSGTLWNSSEGVPAGFYPAWDPDANGATFTDLELEHIQTIWQRVAEDYAPFDVDVTTQDPGDAGIIRANASDQEYGTRALVTPSTIAEGAICGTPVPSCGGVAYLNVFGTVEPAGQHQPAWVFPQSLSNNPKNIAEAVTHEVGHNLSLSHDGLTPGGGANQGAPCPATQLAYYCGHNQWGAVMGVGYYRPVIQWSKGEYTTANNGQDDLAAIALRAPYRTDEAGGTLATASTTTTGTKYITQATDQDLYLLGACTGSLTVSAATPAPATPSPNLDIKLELLDSAGTVVASNDPPSAMVSVETASGLSASITQAVTGGIHFLRVDGVGVGTPQTGYSDYGSIGAYALTVSGAVCTTTPPAAPLNVAATGNTPARTADVSWAAPTNIGGGPVTGYNVYVNGALATTSAAPSTTLTGLALGTPYDVSVSAVNAFGTSPQAHAAGFTLLEKPSAPAITKAKSGKKGGKKTASVAWSAPSSTGGVPITGYQVIVVKAKGGKVVKTVNLAASKTSYVAKLKAGKYKFAVVAVNSVGAGTQSALSKAVTAR